MRPAALTNMPLIDKGLGKVAVEFWELTWNDEKRHLPYEMRLLLSLTNAVGAGRMRQATRELVKAYKTIKNMEKQGKERGEICEILKEKFGEKNPDVKVQ